MQMRTFATAYHLSYVMNGSMRRNQQMKITSVNMHLANYVTGVKAMTITEIYLFIHFFHFPILIHSFHPCQMKATQLPMI